MDRGSFLIFFGFLNPILSIFLNHHSELGIDVFHPKKVFLDVYQTRGGRKGGIEGWSGYLAEITALDQEEAKGGCQN